MCRIIRAGFTLIDGGIWGVNRGPETPKAAPRRRRLMGFLAVILGLTVAANRDPTFNVRTEYDAIVLVGLVALGITDPIVSLDSAILAIMVRGRAGGPPYLGPGTFECYLH
jgi:hypothetical protein